MTTTVSSNTSSAAATSGSRKTAPSSVAEAPATTAVDDKQTNTSTSSSETIVALKGQNVSGRKWKVQPQKRASSLIETTFNNQSTTWEGKVKQSHLRQLARELQQELIDKKKADIALKKERRLENLKRRAENELKVVERAAQQLNAAKLGTTIKAMSKKQLRAIKKTRMNTKTGTYDTELTRKQTRKRNAIILCIILWATLAFIIVAILLLV